MERLGCESFTSATSRNSKLSARPLPHRRQQTRKTLLRKVFNRLVDDPAFLEPLRRRMISGTAGGVEILICHYAKGKPLDRVETGAPGAFAELTNEEFKWRLLRLGLNSRSIDSS